MEWERTQRRELASQMAIDNIPHTYYKLLRHSYPVAIQKAVLEANNLIYSKGQGSIDFHGMGTTCSVLLLLSEGAVVAHVGDSRIYRLRGETLEQLTFDHSLVWEMAEAGHISEEQVPKCIPKNVITRSLGPHQAVEVDLEGPFPVQEGDVFLLCSDGLTGPVNDVELGTLLNCLSTEEAVHTLVDLANLRGGPDNITLAALKINKATQNEGTEEDSESEDSYSTPGSVHSVVWGTLALLLVAGLVFVALNKWIPATIAGIGFLIATGIAFVQRQEKPRETQPIHGPLGKGPYRAFNCTPSQETVDALDRITTELCGIIDSPDWDVDSVEFEALRHEGIAAAGQKQFNISCTKVFCRNSRYDATSQRAAAKSAQAIRMC